MATYRPEGAAFLILIAFGTLVERNLHVQYLPHFGILVGVVLVWYGRRTSSDIRIIGYIILAPAIFGLLKTYSGVDLSGKIAGGAPADGSALPQRDAVASQEAMLPSIKGTTFTPPGTVGLRFGSQAEGGMNLNGGADVSTLRPPGSIGSVKRGGY